MADTSKITLKQLKDAMNKAKKYTDNEIAGVTGVSKVEPEELDMPKVFFNGDKPTNKTSVHATIEYISKTEHFKAYVDIKCQGNSSMAYPKKNYTIKMFKDEARSTKLKKDFKGWGKQSKFCLKANYIDHSHARNIISAKLWGQVVKSRSDFDTLPEELKTSPNYGAVDGFPIKVYYNNTYEGVYTWNIPKDGWMNNMDDKLNTHCILCGEEYNSGCFRSANASLWSDELHDVMPANIVTSFNNFQSFVINSSDDEFKTGLSTYADVNSLIDYYIFQYVICGLDSMGKNQLFFTYDGIKWIASSYDMDSTFGMYWNGQSFVSATYRMQEDYESMTSGRPGNLLYIRMEQLFCDEIKARYAELRAGVLSYANIVNEFERFMDVIGKDLYAEDLTIYTGIPSGNTNNIQQIRNYTRDRLTYVDTQIEALRKLIPCTGIVLSADTLSFTTTDTQTLSVVVSPDNCTDTVNWSVSPAGIVTVKNGVVTPIANGNCTVTATCGTQSATCAVNVALPVVECTSISLDKDTLSLSGSSGTSNLLTGIPNSIVSNNVTFDAITLQPGIYKFANIDGGSFTYLGYTVNDGTKQEPNKNSTAPLLFELTETSSVVLNAYPNNIATNTYDKLALYEVTKGQEIPFTVAGDGYYENANHIAASSNDKYIEAVTLDINKCYVLKYNGTPTLAQKNICMVINGVLTHSKAVNTGDIVKLIYNTSALNLSCNISRGNTIDDLVLYEAETLGTGTMSSYQLTATVTPDNCTQPVVWSVSPEGIVTVNNGLVRAVTNGEATITATCGTQTATCAVTVSGMSESGGGTDIYATAEYAITEPRTFNGTSDYIDTGIKLFDTAKTFTIFIDYASNTPTANNKATIFHCLHEQAPSYRGLCLMEDGNNDRYFIGGQLTGNQYVGDLPSTGKYLISFVNGVINNVVTLNSSNELVHSATDMASANPYAQISENLLIGCYQDTTGTKGRFWSGTINKLGVWYKQLTETEINQVFGKNDGGTDTTLLYSLPEETVFNATSTYIDTGVALLSTDQDFTIALDVTPAASQVNNYAAIFHCMHEESPYPGLAFMAYNTNNTFYIPKGNNSSIIGQGPYLISESIRTKVVIIKEGTTLSAYSSNSVTGSSNYTYTQVSENLLIGAYQTTNGTKGRYFSGIIHDFKIYNKVFTSEEKDAYLIINDESSRVFKIDSTCMNTADNTLTDNIAGISATLTGNPTVSGNQIVFDVDDTFSFDISSLNLRNSNRTFRIKFTPTNLNVNLRNIIGIGNSNNSWSNITSSYITSEKLICQHGTAAFTNNTVGSSSNPNANNRLTTAPVIGQEYELVISEHINGNIRWFIDGTLVQDGTTTLFDPLYLSNTEGNNRFIGSYSLIEIYDGYCNDYTEFTNMVNN